MPNLSEVAIVDLSLAEDEVASSIRTACEEFGFFYIRNHGVQSSIIKSGFEASRKFFSLPVDLKRTVLQNHLNRGYTPMGEETLDPSVQVTGDTKEGYYIGREIPLDHPDERERGPLRGPNQWPDEELLGIKGWRRDMQNYFDALVDLAYRLMGPFACGLGLPANFFDQHFDRPTVLLRPLHYSSVPSQPHAGIFAAGAHSDYGVLTILATDSTPGLQIQTKTGSWLPVNPIEDTFIVNVGDLTEIWTNGLFPSTVHRVISSGENERYSLAFFWEPNIDCVVTPLPECITADRPQRYEAVVYGDYIMSKYSQTHSGYSR